MDQRVKQMLRENGHDFEKAVAEVMPWWRVLQLQHPCFSNFCSSLLSVVVPWSVDSSFGIQPPVDAGLLVPTADPLTLAIQDASSDFPILHPVQLSTQNILTDNTASSSWQASLPPATDDYLRSRVVYSELPPDTSYTTFPSLDSSPDRLIGQKLWVRSFPGPSHIAAFCKGYLAVDLIFDHAPWLYEQLTRFSDRQSGDVLSLLRFIQRTIQRLTASLFGMAASLSFTLIGLQLLSLMSVPQGKLLTLCAGGTAIASTMLGRNLSRTLSANGIFDFF